MEKYVPLQIGCSRFLDRYRFLSSSYQKLIRIVNTFDHMDSNGFKDPCSRNNYLTFKENLAFKICKAVETSPDFWV